MIREDESLRVETSRLRKIRTLDAKAYRGLKTRLPYVVGSDFGDNPRHSDYFVAAHFVLLDLDGMTLPEGRVPEAICQHESVRLAFVSPSGAGVKVLCQLSEPCASLPLFKEFYRPFASQFAETVRLAGNLDLRTCDATRACFLSHDPAAYENPQARPVDWKSYVSTPELTLAAEAEYGAAVGKAPLNEAAYREVLREINPRSTVKAAPQAYVPEQLLAMQDDIRRVCLQYSLEVTALVPINYGLKVQARQGYRLAEVNLFFGKKGFTLVRSPKTGTDLALAEVLYRALDLMLHPPQEAMGVPLTVLLSVN
jgi:hypothetical protein